MLGAPPPLLPVSRHTPCFFIAYLLSPIGLGDFLALADAIRQLASISFPRMTSHRQYKDHNFNKVWYLCSGIHLLWKLGVVQLSQSSVDGQIQYAMQPRPRKFGGTCATIPRIVPPTQKIISAQYDQVRLSTMKYDAYYTDYTWNPSQPTSA